MSSADLHRTKSSPVRIKTTTRRLRLSNRSKNLLSTVRAQHQPGEGCACACLTPWGHAGDTQGHAPARPSPTVALLTFSDVGADGGMLLGERRLLLLEVGVQRHLALVPGLPLQGVCERTSNAGRSKKT